ncbi:MAG: alpha 1 type collagen [Labilithrix sp.]|nr:alpha 1 type collagen [Labilithrix sp.]
MMILSRIWYVILAILLAAAYYVVSLAVGQYNRRNQAAMDETLKADSQVVSWAMQVDARRRLDVLLLAAADPGIGKALKGANGKETVPPASKDDGAKALRTFNDKLPADYKNDAVFLTDREGRLVSQIGYEQVAAYPDFELGGYAAVFDALHGFLRDDTWVWGGRIARVVTRPVEDEVGQPPLGAVVGVRWVDKGFAKEIGKRTRTNIAFFALGQSVASAATTEGFEEQSLEALGSDLAAVSTDKQFKESGRTDVRPLGTDDKGGVLFVRLPGDGWELGAGFAVARQKVSIAGPLGFINGADDQDKRNVKLWIVALVVLGASIIGILFSFLEHSMPMGEMRKQADKLKKGELDVLQLPRFRGGYRPIASDINNGIQRVVEKGGGTARKPADLESILGPVPAQPSMSAFSFPMNDPSAPPQTAPNMGGGFNQPANAATQTAGNNRFPGAPPPQSAPSRPGAPPPPVGSRPGAGTPGPGVPMSGGHPGGPPGFPGIPGNERTMAMPGAPGGNAGNGAFNAPPGNVHPGAGSHSATVAAAPGAAAKLAMQPTAPAPFPPSSQAGPGALAKDEDEQTMVAQPSADLIAATGGHNAATDPAAEWHQVYEEFLRTKRECNEPTDGLTFEKFQQTLKKNRDALMQRHGCKRVKFSVYVKEGRASLKATPVRD